MAAADEREHGQGAALREPERAIADDGRDGDGDTELDGDTDLDEDEDDEQQPSGEAVLELLESRGVTDCRFRAGRGGMSDRLPGISGTGNCPRLCLL